MTEDFEQEFVIGEDVTDQLTGKRPGTVILSIPLASAEIAGLSELATCEDKNEIEVAQEAIRAWVKARTPASSRSTPSQQ